MRIIIPHLTLCRGPRSLARPSFSETYLILPKNIKDSFLFVATG